MFQFRTDCPFPSLVLAGAALTLGGCADAPRRLSQPPPAVIEARMKAFREQEEQDRANAPRREALRLAYLDFIASVFPSYNGLRAGMSSGYPQGYELMAQHPFFSQFTFATGPQAQAVYQWIVEHRAELDECHIAVVGVYSPEDSRAFFKLSPGVLPVLSSRGRVLN